MWFPANFIFLVLLGVVSPIYGQQINDAPNITNQGSKSNGIHSTIIPRWEDSAAIAFLVLLAVIVISVPCVIVLIRIRRKNRKARRLTSRGTTNAPGTAGGRSYKEDDYEMGLRKSQGDLLANERKEGWTLKEVEVIMRGGDPNNPDGFPAKQVDGGYRPTTSASVQSQQQPVALQPLANTANVKPIGISRATSVKVTKVKAVTVVKGGRADKGGDGSALASASVASSPRRPETALTMSN
jgi:hypothetical protein